MKRHADLLTMSYGVQRLTQRLLQFAHPDFAHVRTL